MSNALNFEQHARKLAEKMKKKYKSTGDDDLDGAMSILRGKTSIQELDRIKQKAEKQVENLVLYFP